MKIDPKTFIKDFHLNFCIQCGTCTGGCPVKYRSPLNMRRRVRETHLTDNFSSISKRAELWACTTCSTCSLRCPSGVKNVELIMGIRNFLANKGEVPSTIRDALQKAEVDFGILGKKESCCGNEIRRMGEQALFKKLAKDNTALFKKSGVKKIITISPHCYNAFKNEYPDLNIPVQHYTQVLADLIESGKLNLSKGLEIRATFHDPCFLGKQNQVFDEPRKILASIPGCDFIEMDRSRERSLCCEGGGGRMWAEGGTEGKRNGEIRIREAVAIGAKTLATACPFCLLTFEDAIKISGFADQIVVKDIAELIAESI